MAFVSRIQRDINNRSPRQFQMAGRPLEADPSDMGMQGLPHHAAEYAMKVIRREMGNTGEFLQGYLPIKILLDENENTQHPLRIILKCHFPHVVCSLILSALRTPPAPCLISLGDERIGPLDRHCGIAQGEIAACSDSNGPDQ